MLTSVSDQINVKFGQVSKSSINSSSSRDELADLVGLERLVDPTMPSPILTIAVRAEKTQPILARQETAIERWLFCRTNSHPDG